MYNVTNEEVIEIEYVKKGIREIVWNCHRNVAVFYFGQKSKKLIVKCLTNKENCSRLMVKYLTIAVRL